jgi:hypothetical protein
MWKVCAKVDASRVDNPSALKEQYGCDLVIKNNQNIFFILDEIIDVEYEDI